jgi:hypothetical protein
MPAVLRRAIDGYVSLRKSKIITKAQLCANRPNPAGSIYWTEESAQNVSIGLLPLLSILRGVSVYLSLSTAQATAQATA